jgi:hypothetical protein
MKTGDFKLTINNALRLISPSAERRPKPVQDITDIYKTTSYEGLIMWRLLQIDPQLRAAEESLYIHKAGPENIRREQRKLSSLRCFRLKSTRRN